MLHLLTRFTRETFIFTKELNTHIHWDGTKKENELFGHSIDIPIFSDGP